MNILKKLILSSILIGFVSCATPKGKCDAYATGNPNHGKKPYYQRKK